MFSIFGHSFESSQSIQDIPKAQKKLRAKTVPRQNDRAKMTAPKPAPSKQNKFSAIKHFFYANSSLLVMFYW